MEDKKQISKNLILTIIAYGISLTIAFVLTPYLINNLGVEAYGFFPLANTIIGYSSILTVAINSMGNRFIAVAFHKGEFDKAKKYFVSIFVADIALAVFIFFIGIVGIVFLEKLINIPVNLTSQVKWLFFCVLLGSMVTLALTAFRASTFVKNRIDINAYIRMLKSTIRAFALILFFSLFEVNLIWLGFATLIILTFEAVSYLKVKTKVLSEIEINMQHFSWDALKEVTKSGSWNLLTKAKHIMLVGLDLYIANLFLGPVSVGILAIVKSLTVQYDSIIGMLGNAFMPVLTKTYSNDENKLKTAYETSFIPLYLIGSVILGGILAVGDVFYGLWVPTQDSAQLYMLTVLTLGNAFICYGYSNVTSIYIIKNKLKLVSILQTLQALLSIILVIVLLKYSNIGIYAIAGVSSVIGIIGNLCFTSIYVAKLLKQKWYTVYLYSLKSLLCLGVVVGIGYLVRTVIDIDSWITLFACAIIIALVSLSINLFIVTNRSQRKFLLDKVLTYVKTKK